MKSAQDAVSGGPTAATPGRGSPKPGIEHPLTVPSRPDAGAKLKIDLVERQSAKVGLSPERTPLTDALPPRTLGGLVTACIFADLDWWGTAFHTDQKQPVQPRPSGRTEGPSGHYNARHTCLHTNAAAPDAPDAPDAPAGSTQESFGDTCIMLIIMLFFAVYGRLNSKQLFSAETQLRTAEGLLLFLPRSKRRSWQLGKLSDMAAAALAREVCGDAFSPEGIECDGKVVVYRADLNVPVVQGRITDSSRIDATLPTLSLLLSKGARVAVISHFGRPNPAKQTLEEMRKEYSLGAVADALAQKLTPGPFQGLAADCIGPEAEEAVAKLKPGQVRGAASRLDTLGRYKP